MSNDNNDKSKDHAYDEDVKQKNLRILEAKVKEAEKDAIRAEIEAKRAAFPAEISSESPELSSAGAEGEISGKISIESGAGYYAEICAYKALKDVADKIATKVKEDVKDKKVILIKDENFTSKVALWLNIQFRIKTIIEEIQTNIDEAKKIMKDEVGAREVATTLAAISGILAALTEIAKYFKADFALKSKTIDVDERALIAEMAAKLKGEVSELILLGFTTSSELTNVGLIAELQEKREDCLATINEVDEWLNDPNHQEHPNKTDLVNIRKEMDELLKGLNNFLDYLSLKPDKGLSPIEMIFEIDLILNNKDALVLSVFIASKGADIETYQHSIKNNQIIFNGGVVVGYFLTNQDGKCLCAGTEIGFNSKRKKTNESIPFKKWLKED
jgi:hypothetical protein